MSLTPYGDFPSVEPTKDIRELGTFPADDLHHGIADAVFALGGDNGQPTSQSCNNAETSHDGTSRSMSDACVEAEKPPLMPSPV
jgi:hypothetical protein